MRSAPDQDRGLGRWTITTGVWVLAGLLLISIAVILTAREEERAFPSVTNTRGSGYAAFAELLQQDGYSVSLDRSVRPKFGQGDVVLATEFEYLSDAYFEQHPLAKLQEPAIDPHADQMYEHLDSGGTVIEVINRREFEDTSANAARSETIVTSSLDKTKSHKVTIPSYGLADTLLEDSVAPYNAWVTSNNEALVEYRRVGDGLLVTITDGLPLTNRYLDDAENAAFVIGIVRQVAPEGAHIVFDESGIGNADAPTVTNTLGKWAVAARWQAILLFGVLVYTFGKRFGLPQVEKTRVRSSRELFDAISDVFRRTSNTGLALDNLLLESDQRLRRVLNASPSLKRSELLQLVPGELRQQYAIVAEHAQANSPPRKATDAAKRLLTMIDGFERDSRESRGLKR